MNNDLLMFKGIISDLTQEQRDNILECKTKIKTLIDEYGEEGIFAFTWLGLEYQEELYFYKD